MSVHFGAFIPTSGVYPIEPPRSEDWSTKVKSAQAQTSSITDENGAELKKLIVEQIYKIYSDATTLEVEYAVSHIFPYYVDHSSELSLEEAVIEYFLYC